MRYFILTSTLFLCFCNTGMAIGPEIDIKGVLSKLLGGGGGEGDKTAEFSNRTHTKTLFRRSTVHGNVYVTNYIIADNRRYHFNRSFNNRTRRGNIAR